MSAVPNRSRQMLRIVNAIVCPVCGILLAGCAITYDELRARLPVYETTVYARPDRAAQCVARLLAFEVVTMTLGCNYSFAEVGPSPRTDYLVRFEPVDRTDNCSPCNTYWVDHPTRVSVRAVRGLFGPKVPANLPDVIAACENEQRPEREKAFGRACASPSS